MTLVGWTAIVAKRSWWLHEVHDPGQIWDVPDARTVMRPPTYKLKEGPERLARPIWTDQSSKVTCHEYLAFNIERLCASSQTCLPWTNVTGSRVQEIGSSGLGWDWLYFGVFECIVVRGDCNCMVLRV